MLLLQGLRRHHGTILNMISHEFLSLKKDCKTNYRIVESVVLLFVKIAPIKSEHFFHIWQNIISGFQKKIVF